MNRPIVLFERKKKTKLVPSLSSAITVKISTGSMLILLILLSRKTIENPSKESLKLSRNILPKKSGNPESLKK